MIFILISRILIKFAVWKELHAKKGRRPILFLRKYVKNLIRKAQVFKFFCFFHIPLFSPP